MPIIKQKDWDKWVDNNKDSYGKCCVDVAREVMRLLDENNVPLHNGYHPDINTPHGLICKADDNIKAGGITGFMSGAIANMVSHCHSRGEEFRKIWNAPYLNKDQEDKGGVVNPAILTIQTKE